VALFERVQTLFAALGLLGGTLFGLLLLIGPEGLRAPIAAEIPRLGLLAGAFSAIFATFFVALVAETFAPASAATYRLKAMRWVGMLLVVGGFAAWMIVDGGGDVWRLWREGRPAQATIERVDQRRTAPIRSNRVSVASRLVYRHQLAFDGHRATLERRDPIAPGTSLPIVYLPSRPELLLPAEHGTSLFGLIRSGPGIGWSALLVVVLVACLIAVPGQLWSALVGPREGAPGGAP
jgi:hypothetical protein